MKAGRKDKRKRSFQVVYELGIKKAVNLLKHRHYIKTNIKS